MRAGGVHFPAMRPVAFFVSPHGFGHAARSCAVMAEMRRQCPTIHFEVLTEVPRWFFDDSLPDCFSYHHLAADVGLIQRSPLVEDLDATVDRLDDAWRDDSVAQKLGAGLRELGCSMTMVDISPLGLTAAAAASIPSVLIESFTWDWIYAEYADAPSRLREHGRRLREAFDAAELRIQAEPVCEPISTAASVPPIARSPSLDKEEVFHRLGIPAGEPMIVVSMGGVPWDYSGFAKIEHSRSAWVVVPGGTEECVQRNGRVVLLPFHADFYHPDLVAASDIVVSKLGYSTVAETYRAGAALAYVGRPRFPESPVLARWVEENMVAAEIEEEELLNGAWLAAAEELLETPRRKPVGPNGAERAAEIILQRFESILD